MKVDLTNRQELIYYLRSHRLWPQKKLGQNFLVDKNILEKIIKAAKLKDDDTVLEIGPGVGTLTWGLSPKVKNGLVLAVEKDFKLVELLRERFKNAKQVKIVHDDIRRFDLCSIKRGYKVVANIPYHLASVLIRKLLEVRCKKRAILPQDPDSQAQILNQARGANIKNNSAPSHAPSLIVLTVQKEVADRLIAKPGDSNRGVLTVMAELLAESEIIAAVPRSSFYPEPNVDSAIIRLRPKRQLRGDYHLIRQVVKAGFSAKRRQLHNSLAGGLGLSSSQICDILKQARVNGQKRAEDLTIREWRAVAKAWYQQAIKS